MRVVCVKLVILAAMTLLHAAHADVAKPLKVFVLAGQSNMVGKRSKARELPPELQREQPGALFFTGSAWVPLKAGVTEKRGFGPEISFAGRVSAALGEPIGIMKVSVGGTSLAVDWSPQRRNSLYRKLLALVEKGAEFRPIRVVGMVWLQGGRDAKNKAHAEAYRSNFEAFIQRARADFKSPNMAFVCGRSASPEKKYPHVGLVREAQEHVRLPGYAWVDCDSIPMGSDGVHYSTKGHVESGRLLADVMLKLLVQRGGENGGAGNER